MEMRVNPVVCFTVDIMKLSARPYAERHYDNLDGCAYLLVVISSSMLSRRQGRIYDFYSGSAQMAFTTW